MKKQAVLWAALAVVAWVWTAAGQTVTLTLDQNYTGAPANTTRATDAYGCIVGDPLPVPTRAGQAFRGWFTAATGGSRVIIGATGTKFTQNATLYAQWAASAPVDMSAMPVAMKENFDWLKNVRYPNERYLSTNNTIFDQIWGGGGTLNYAVRWESFKKLTLQQRQQIAAMLHEAINQFTRPLIGMEGWPFQEVAVRVAGYAVHDDSVIVNRQPNEVLWVNNAYDGQPGAAEAAHPTDRIASVPRNLTRLNNLTAASNGTYQYPGGLNARVDIYLWCTEYNFGAAGHGSYWGQRLGDNAITTAAGRGGAGSGVLLHEIGHSFGWYDFYNASDRPPTTSNGVSFNSGISVMWGNTGSTTLNTYDQWQIRYYWDWARSIGNASRFRLPATSVMVPMAAANAKQPSQFRFDNRGTLKYDLGGAQTASLKIFDIRGKLVKTMQLSGTQTTVNTNLNVASQMLIWKVEASGKIMDQGKMQFVSR